MSQVALDFDEALANFKVMFPDVPQEIIVETLRRENGDVDKIVNELLAFSSNPGSSRTSGSGGSNSRGSDVFYLEPPPPYSEVVKKHGTAPTLVPSTSSRPTEPRRETVVPKPSTSLAMNSSSNNKVSQDETIDDEKIALMIQNEEFLNYLRNNSAFMREIYGTNTTARSAPRSLVTSRPYSSSSSLTSGRYQRDSYIPLTPNGPVVEVATSSIPNGPLVDYNYNDSTIWSKRIMSKLPGRKSGDYTYQDSCTSTAVASYYNPNDFSSKLRAMSKTSKIMFLALARKFGSRPAMKLLPDYDANSRRNF